MQRLFVFLSVLSLLIASLACGRLNRTDQGSGGTASYNTKFPLPPSILNFADMGNGAINFQTKMSIKDTLDWYRQAFSQKGLKERTTNTAITTTTFSMVFDGDPSGQAVVIQGVDLGNGLTNVNIRYEKV
ncbi:MAG TPA: hypothetical protein VF784_00325 [Anaerolineales bacterium]